MEEHGNYLIKPLQVIGCGAFGRVEQIELYNTNGHKCGIYARKVLSVRKELVGPIFDYDDWRRRFEREVKYQAACSHFNVVPIYIHHLNSGVPWFVMDLAITDLKKEIRSGVLSNVEKIKIVEMILSGVEFIHQKGFFHRDLKPENILRFADGMYKVSDFGLVKNKSKEAESEVLTKIAVKMGTDGYRAPEASDGIYNEKTDIYALGAIINEIKLDNLPGLSDLINKSTSYVPAGRYNSVSEMRANFNHIIKGAGL